MNAKGVALVPPDDSAMQVAVKANIDDQFASLAASIFARRNRSAIPSGNIQDLLDSLGDLAPSRTLATVTTTFVSSTARGGTATGSARSGNVSPIVGQDNKLKLDDT